ncbi:hypothetical protein [Neobacillus drentensis]|uniref:hypothetical protein n=1 Tax=Neobacillus drentensis TaxID=220684 RepID=UPI002FFFD2D2
MITLVVLAGLNYVLTYYTHTKFLDYSFFVGMVVTIIIWFFTSKGGYSSRSLDMTVQGSTGIKMDAQKYEFSPNIAFLTSLAYTIITLGVMLYQYRSYF